MSNFEVVAKFVSDSINDDVLIFTVGCVFWVTPKSDKTKLWQLELEDINNVAKVIQSAKYPTDKILAKFNQKFLAV
jgi:hypothetical protein